MLILHLFKVVFNIIALGMEQNCLCPSGCIWKSCTLYVSFWRFDTCRQDGPLHGSFGICINFEENLERELISSFSKSPIFKLFSVDTLLKLKAGVFKISLF